MKSKEFLSELRMIIREEVSYAVRQELKKVLTESASIQKKQVQEAVSKQTVKPVQTQVKRKLQFKDPGLAELLESVNSTPGYEKSNQQVGFEDWPTMDYSSGMNFKTNTTPNAAPNGVSIEQVEQVSPELAKAFTRD